MIPPKQTRARSASPSSFTSFLSLTILQSFYTFGYIDQAILSASGATTPTYTNVDSTQGFWQIPSTSATINGTAVPRPNNTSIMDTGTTLCLVDDALVEAVYNAIPNAKYDQSAQGYVFPVSTPLADLPDVTLAIGNDASVIFQKEDLGFADAGNGMVYGSIQSRGSMTMDIYGDAVLKAMYAVCFIPLLFFSFLFFVRLLARADFCPFDSKIFDMNNGAPRFGWVQRKEATQNTAAPPSQ